MKRSSKQGSSPAARGTQARKKSLSGPIEDPPASPRPDIKIEDQSESGSAEVPSMELPPDTGTDENRKSQNPTADNGVSQTARLCNSEQNTDETMTDNQNLLDDSTGSESSWPAGAPVPGDNSDLAHAAGPDDMECCDEASMDENDVEGFLANVGTNMRQKSKKRRRNGPSNDTNGNDLADDDANQHQKSPSAVQNDATDDADFASNENDLALSSDSDEGEEDDDDDDDYDDDEDKDDIVDSDNDDDDYLPTQMKTNQRKRKRGYGGETQSLTTPFHSQMKASNAHSEQPYFAQESGTQDEPFESLIQSVPESEREQFAKKWRTMMNKLLRAAARFSGQVACKPGNRKEYQWDLKGLISGLTHHQMLNASNMRQLEAEEGEGNHRRPMIQPPGGILGDDMGLGKTVQVIALIVNDRQPCTKLSPRAFRPTLIVVPPTLVEQWYAEIAAHADPDRIRTATIFKPRFAGENSAQSFWAQQGVIIASYAHVRASYPKFKAQEPWVGGKSGDTCSKKTLDENKGVLHRIRFRRIVLDEGHHIKNHRSHTSLACAELMADFRWVVTGTPIQNRISELYSYFRFLKTPKLGSFREFNKYFLDNGIPNEKLNVYIRPFLIRKTHRDQTFGADLVSLPESFDLTYRCETSPIEKAIYDIFHIQAIERINSLKKDAASQKHMGLIMFNELRMLNDHPFLAHHKFLQDFGEKGFEKLKLALNSECTRNIDQAQRIRLARHRFSYLKSMAKLEHQRKPHSKVVSIDSSDVTWETVQHTQPGNLNELAVGKDFGLSDTIAEYIGSLHEQQKHKNYDNGTSCGQCHNLPQDEMLMSCGHIYCKACAIGLFGEAQISGRKAMCKTCGRILDCRKAIDQEVHQKKGQNDDEKQTKRNGDSIVSDEVKISGPTLWEYRHMISSRMDVEKHKFSSSKTLAIKAMTLELLEEDPDVKIIIFTDFLCMVALMEKICDIEEWAYVSIHGALPRAARDRAIEDFKREKKYNILISTTQVGGFGLNLVEASTVIIADAFWNTAVEKQAFGRTFRRGQQKKTTCIRIVVPGSIDERVLAIQQGKNTKIDRVMSPEAMYKEHPKEILAWFGPVCEDEDGNRYVLKEGIENPNMNGTLSAMTPRARSNHARQKRQSKNPPKKRPRVEDMNDSDDEI